MTSKSPREPILDVSALNDFLDRHFPEIYEGGRSFVVEAVGPMTCRIRMTYRARHLRPGGTIAGPAMFALADVSLYLTTLAHIGPIALAVTTNLNINFLRKPAQRDLIGECRLLKLGKRLSVGEVMLFSDGTDDLVAHATGTYSIPVS